MDKKELSTEYADSYRTGEVQPPKSHRGLISLLLLLVIFLGSLVSVLGFWGIRLFQQLQNEETSSVKFIADMQLSQEEEDEDILEVSSLGAEGYFLTAFDRRYFNMPPGFYITQVDDPLSGLRPGDLLVQIDDTPISGPGDLFSALESHGPGAVLSLEVYRNGTRKNLNATLEITGQQ